MNGVTIQPNCVLSVRYERNKIEKGAHFNGEIVAVKNDEITLNMQSDLLKKTGMHAWLEGVFEKDFLKDSNNSEKDFFVRTWIKPLAEALNRSGDTKQTLEALFSFIDQKESAAKFILGALKSVPFGVGGLLAYCISQIGASQGALAAFLDIFADALEDKPSDLALKALDIAALPATAKESWEKRQQQHRPYLEMVAKFVATYGVRGFVCLCTNIAMQYAGANREEISRVNLMITFLGGLIAGGSTHLWLRAGKKQRAELSVAQFFMQKDWQEKLSVLKREHAISAHALFSVHHLLPKLSLKPQYSYIATGMRHALQIATVGGGAIAIENINRQLEKIEMGENEQAILIQISNNILLLTIIALWVSCQKVPPLIDHSVCPWITKTYDRLRKAVTNVGNVFANAAQLGFLP